MAAAFGALGDDDIGAGLRRTYGFRDAAGHEGDFGAGLMGAVDERLYVLLGSRPGEGDRRRAQLERRGEAFFDQAEQQEIQREGLVGFGPDRGRAAANSLGAQAVTAHRAEPAGIRDRRDQIGRIDRAHAAERDRMHDAQHVANPRADHVVLAIFMEARCKGSSRPSTTLRSEG
ncbi:MAG TPA: hypothetical protein VNF99_10375 [Stellaceae bacterium]|nr:hypothetical protein [Stellaceae bacterium]